MTSADSSAPPDPTLPQLEHLWNQYKYRHELCWSAVYKVTVAVVALGVIPYAKDALSRLLGYWMLAPAVLGSVLAGFGIALVNNELAIFANVKFAFHLLQNEFLDSVMPDEQSKKAAEHTLTVCKLRHTKFDWYVNGFMVGLLVMSIANAVFVVVQWIPHVLSTPAVATAAATRP